VAACSEAYADELASDNGTRNDQAAHDEPVIPLIFYTANVPAEEAKIDGYGGEAEAEDVGGEEGGDLGIVDVDLLEM